MYELRIAHVDHVPTGMDGSRHSTALPCTALSNAPGGRGSFTHPRTHALMLVVIHGSLDHREIERSRRRRDSFLQLLPLVALAPPEWPPLPGPAPPRPRPRPAPAPPPLPRPPFELRAIFSSYSFSLPKPASLRRR